MFTLSHFALLLALWLQFACSCADGVCTNICHCSLNQVKFIKSFFFSFCLWYILLKVLYEHSPLWLPRCRCFCVLPENHLKSNFWKMYKSPKERSQTEYFCYWGHLHTENRLNSVPWHWRLSFSSLIIPPTHPLAILMPSLRISDVPSFYWKLQQNSLLVGMVSSSWKETCP